MLLQELVDLRAHLLFLLLKLMDQVRGQGTSRLARAVPLRGHVCLRDTWRANQILLLFRVLVEYTVHFFLQFLVPIALRGCRHLDFVDEGIVLHLHRLKHGLVFIHQFLIALFFSLCSVQVLDAQ